MFISFEGIDFCGKSTQIRLLNDYFTAKGLETLLIREPGGTHISEKVRDILLDNKIHGMTIETEILLFSAARAQLVRNVINPALAQGKIVLSDRFFDSTTAYQGYGRGVKPEFVEQINSFAVGDTIPALTFFLDVTVAKALERRSTMKSEPDRMEQSGRDFYERVRNGYIQLAAKHSRFVRIDAMQPIEIVHRQIVERMEHNAK
jgi:dTMP kinase